MRPRFTHYRAAVPGWGLTRNQYWKSTPNPCTIGVVLRLGRQVLGVQWRQPGPAPVEHYAEMWTDQETAGRRAA